MTTRIKSVFAAGATALMLAGPGSAEATAGKGTEVSQDQQQQPRQERRGPGGPGGPRGMRGGPGMELRGLDLTDDQRAQLRKIREARQ